MKIRTASSLFLATIITAALALATRNVSAQDSTTSAAQTAPVQLSYGVSQIVQLSKANVSEGTIVSYIQNSGSSYGLDANQIVYLKQQGVSDTVINTMLTQPRQVVQTMSQQDYSTASSVSTATVVAPSAVSYVPSSTVYVIPDTQTYQYYGGYYHPYYGEYSGWRYPSVSFSFGFGGGYRGGYYRSSWGGGYHGSYHGGGGWHH